MRIYPDLYDDDKELDIVAWCVFALAGIGVAIGVLLLSNYASQHPESERHAEEAMRHF